MPTGKVHPFEPADLFVTERLYERPHRPPDLHAEAEAFHELSAGLLSDPDASVHRFLELALQLCHAGSAGLSLIEHDERDEEIFRWALIKGSYAPTKLEDGRRDHSALAADPYRRAGPF